jgi:hypothetical protein
VALGRCTPSAGSWSRELASLAVDDASIRRCGARARFAYAQRASRARARRLRWLRRLRQAWLLCGQRGRPCPVTPFWRRCGGAPAAARCVPCPASWRRSGRFGPRAAAGASGARRVAPGRPHSSKRWSPRRQSMSAAAGPLRRGRGGKDPLWEAGAFRLRARALPRGAGGLRATRLLRRGGRPASRLVGPGARSRPQRAAPGPAQPLGARRRACSRRAFCAGRGARGPVLLHFAFFASAAVAAARRSDRRPVRRGGSELPTVRHGYAGVVREARPPTVEHSAGSAERPGVGALRPRLARAARAHRGCWFW